MPGITARICGYCPISHLLASSKACDAIMAVRISTGGQASCKGTDSLRQQLRADPTAAQLLFIFRRRIFFWAGFQIVATRNVLGVIADASGLARGR